MPELPEVETVRRTLKEKILNKKIVKVDILYENIVKTDLFSFKTKLINQEFIDILRKGKYLIFELNENYLISHLRMEGKYFFVEKGYALTKHDHIAIHFSDNVLVYNDVRKFGTLDLINKEELELFFYNLGLEPNELSYEYLKEKFNKKIDIKTLLLDQSIIAGIGNIYANEILFKTKINPYKFGNKLTKTEINNVIKYTNKILDKAIEKKGTTIKSYTSSLGVEGTYQEDLLVHMKDKCAVCSNNIIKEKIKGRSVYYCSKCQK